MERDGFTGSRFRALVQVGGGEMQCISIILRILLYIKLIFQQRRKSVHDIFRAGSEWGLSGSANSGEIISPIRALQLSFSIGLV